jgi:hypothetical protein
MKLNKEENAILDTENWAYNLPVIKAYHSQKISLTRIPVRKELYFCRYFGNKFNEFS